MDALQTNIYVNSECNRSCPHCYYPKTGDKMDRKMAGKVIEWLLQLYRNEGVKLFKIHFLGGEPILNFEPMMFIVENIDRWKPDYTKPHSDGEFVVFTNGDFLSPGKLDRMKHYNVKVMLNPCHDDIDILESKITRIKKVMHGCSLAIALDEYNLDRIEKLTDLALRYHCHIRTNRLYDGGNIVGYKEKYEKAMLIMLDKLLSSDWVMWPNYVIESTYPLWESPKNPHACGRWLLVVDPNGRIRTCNADCTTVCGHIDTHTSLSSIHFLHRWSSKLLEDCRGCEWEKGGWCQGGCPYTRKLTYGTYEHKTPFCSTFKKLFPKVLELKERWIREHGMV